MNDDGFKTERSRLIRMWPRALRDWGRPEVFESSILEYNPDRKWDLVLINGVFSLFNPEELDAAFPQDDMTWFLLEKQR